MRDPFTGKSNLNQVVQSLPNQSFAHMIRMGDGLGGKLLGTISFERLSKMSGGIWSAQTITEGMNFVSEQANRRDIFYPLWGGDLDRGRKLTGIAAFVQEKPSRYVMICAGGGYNAVATMQEAFPVARALYDRGYSSFVLQYRCGKYAQAPNPMDDLAQAVRFAMEHSKEFQLDGSDYAVMGFSAGGHLAASFGTETLGYTRYGIPKPGAMFLAYPVITMGEYAHVGSRDNLLGKTADKTLWEQWSIEKQITPAFPPTFLWQCDQDNAVPIQNSRLMAKGLERANVPFEYETFSSTAHGWGLGTGTAADGWLDRALQFWADQSKARKERMK